MSKADGEMELRKTERELRKNSYKVNLLFDWVGSVATSKVPGEYKLIAEAMEEVAVVLRQFAKDTEQQEVTEKTKDRVRAILQEDRESDSFLEEYYT